MKNCDICRCCSVLDGACVGGCLNGIHHDKCQSCGEDIGEGGSYDGCCIDCWPGYDSCARPGCDHYRCEHQFPENKWSVAYSKDSPESVGEAFTFPIGCMVYDGPDHCAEFVEPEKPRSRAR